MSNFGVSNSIRSPKVTTGNASQYAGTRFFSESAQVCPSRANVSDYGVAGVARDTIQTYAPGCFSAENRIAVENNVSRFKYSTFLNASAINLPGVGDDDMVVPDMRTQNKPFYDTQLGNQFTRPVSEEDEMHPVYYSSDFVPADGVEDDFKRDMNDIAGFMNHTYENRRYRYNKPYIQ